MPLVAAVVAGALTACSQTETAHLGPRLEGDGTEGVEVNTVETATAAAYPLTEEPSDDPMMALLTIETSARFSARDCGPFRIIAQGPPARAAMADVRIVRPACELMRKQFFDRSPERGVRIVLFSDDATYRAGARALSGEAPDTPYGYYSHDIKAVVMNLATGGGTLVHELVHAFAEADFPAIPAWINEGLGSLFEQSSFAGGRIRGLPNWRLPGLQRTLIEEGEGANGMLRRVVSTTTAEFYGEDSGTNYAAARYLFYDMQEKGLLETFYKEIRENHHEDPTGVKTLERVLGCGLEEYEPGWRKRTLRLRYR